MGWFSSRQVLLTLFQAVAQEPQSPTRLELAAFMSFIVLVVSLMPSALAFWGTNMKAGRITLAATWIVTVGLLIFGELDPAAHNSSAHVVKVVVPIALALLLLICLVERLATGEARKQKEREARRPVIHATYNLDDIFKNYHRIEMNNPIPVTLENDGQATAFEVSVSDMDLESGYVARFPELPSVRQRRECRS